MYGLEMSTEAGAIQVTLQPLACTANDLGSALSRVYGLTQAEARVATQLLESGSVAAVASVLRRSEETVRSQLKSVFAKTGVNRQASLIQLMYALGSE